MKVSVITVCYNAADYIIKAIESVLAQKYSNIEYIIVDGKSTDGTLEIIYGYKGRFSKVISEKDEGIYDAMNKGVRISSGDIIFFLNSDDSFYDKDVICDIVKKFKDDDSAGIIYGKVKFENVPKELLPYLKMHRVINKKRELLSSSICHQSLFAKKFVFDKIGLFNSKYKIYADYDWLMTAFNNSIRVKFINRYIATYNYQGHSYQNKAKFERMRIVYKHFSFDKFLFYCFRYILLRELNSKRKNLIKRAINYVNKLNV